MSDLTNEGTENNQLSEISNQSNNRSNILKQDELRAFIITNQTMSKQIQQIMSQGQKNDNIMIINGKWKYIGMHKFSKQILSWNTTTLTLQANRHENILKQISHIHFNRLTSLLLLDNKIQSIQSLNNSFMPLLQQIHLNNNFITEIKALRRMNCPNLKKIGLTNNLINQMQVLSQLNAYNLQSIAVQFQFLKQMCCDVKFCMKLASKKMQFLFIRSQQRVVQENVYSKIKHKNHNFGYGINIRNKFS